jgi:hypothetical protein
VVDALQAEDVAARWGRGIGCELETDSALQSIDGRVRLHGVNRGLNLHSRFSGQGHRQITNADGRTKKNLIGSEELLAT